MAIKSIVLYQKPNSFRIRLNTARKFGDEIQPEFCFC